jgi:type IV pilus assembly protein PilF
MRFAIAALIAVVLGGCVSQTSVETKQVSDPGVADARRRAEVHTSLAGEYYARGNFAVALQETRLAIKDDPSYFAAYNMQGLIYMELREDVPARESFDKALGLSPNNPEVLNNFGWFLCVRNDADRGLAMMDRAAADPLYRTPEKAFFSAGLCLRRMGRNQEAEDRLRRAVLIRPDMVGALYNLADLMYERGATKDADNYLVRSMRLSVPSIEALVLGVKIARANGDKQTEASYMQQLRRRFPESPQLRELEGSGKR